ncbi:hypothetical protein [Shewanella sp. KT0246]|uniref:hypothetical protein n=1 Tax=Shewanella sp. KT0246 TaxID=2815912 RepID=UPI001BBBB6AB|nr:hypothetical protein [Shewanella sp. KT0246]GIU53458.1 hypothetical protein TUM4249_30990 [Shewanella sp. KT0246]
MTSIKHTISTDKQTSRASIIEVQNPHGEKITSGTKVTNTGSNSTNITNNNLPDPSSNTKQSTNQLAQSSLATNTVLLPATVTNQASISSASSVKSDSIAIVIDGRHYQFKANEQISRLIQTGAKLMLNAGNLQQLQTMNAQAVNSANQPLNQQIVLVSQAIKLNLPIEILNLAQSNGVSSQQLLTLASRPQGYPLPLVEINTNRLRFENGTNVMISPLNKLPLGHNLAQITQSAGQLLLRLSPIQLIDSVRMTPTSNKSIDLALVQTTNTVISKQEPVQVLTQFLKKLEQLPFTANITNNSSVKSSTSTTSNHDLPQNLNALLRQPLNSQTLEQLTHQLNQGSKLTVNQFKQLDLQITQNLLKPENTLTANQVNELKLLASKLNPEHSAAQARLDNALKSPIEVLSQNLSKAGALPIQATQANSNLQQNLATQLLKLIPRLDPSPLTELANPELLKAELKSLASLNLSHAVSASNINLSGSAITTLFQLILGFKLNTNSSAMSPRLQAYMAKLQQKVFNSNSTAPQLLAALDKAGSLDAMGKLASSIGLYQQSSSDSNQNLTWYFALPYSIGQRDEQLEGKFEKEPQDDTDNEKAAWQLQLKFNLAQGPLLVKAHKQGDYLDLTFTGNDMKVLEKVEQYQTSLASKIQQVGLQARDISTQIDVVPATLLPGDHYLVKTNA